MRLQKPKLEIRGEYCRDIMKKPWIGILWVNCIHPQIHVQKLWLQCDYLWRQGPWRGDERSCGDSSCMKYSLWKHKDLSLGSEPTRWLTQCWGAGESAVRQVEPWSLLATQATLSQKNPKVNGTEEWHLRLTSSLCTHMQTCACYTNMHTHKQMWKEVIKVQKGPKGEVVTQ